MSYPFGVSNAQLRWKYYTTRPLPAHVNKFPYELLGEVADQGYNLFQDDFLVREGSAPDGRAVWKSQVVTTPLHPTYGTEYMHAVPQPTQAAFTPNFASPTAPIGAQTGPTAAAKPKPHAYPSHFDLGNGDWSTVRGFELPYANSTQTPSPSQHGRPTAEQSRYTPSGHLPLTAETFRTIATASHDLRGWTAHNSTQNTQADVIPPQISHPRHTDGNKSHPPVADLTRPNKMQKPPTAASFARGDSASRRESEMHSAKELTDDQLKECVERARSGLAGAKYFTMIARMTWLATEGKVVWRYLLQRTRNHEMEEITTAAQDGNCPDDARQLLQDCHTALLGVEPFAVHVSDADDDETDLTAKPNLRNLVQEVEQTLFDHIVDCNVFADGDRPTLLRKVDCALTNHIGYTRHLKILAYALILWPNRSFAVESASLRRYSADFSKQSRRAKVPRLRDQGRGKGAADVVDGEEEAADGKNDEEPPLAALNGTAGREPKILNLEHAYRYLGRSKRQIAPEDDDVEYVERNSDWFKDQIFNAIVTLPSDADEYQQRQWKCFEDSFEQARFSLNTIEAKSFEIVETAVDLHKNGCQFNETVDWGMKPGTSKDDNDMTCSERLEHVIVHLAHKVSCEEILLNEQHLIRFVVAPNAVLRSKTANDANNRRRAEKSKLERKALEDAGITVSTPTSRKKRKTAQESDSGDTDAGTPTRKPKLKGVAAASRIAPSKPASPSLGGDEDVNPEDEA
ncbi:hypothetical protein LTR08_005397 [Meristemomyces frigidus]|nr:hypothetical protein LTR08_005397 [Meristemomyces frigidus]